MGIEAYLGVHEPFFAPGASPCSNSMRVGRARRVAATSLGARPVGCYGGIP